MFWIKYVCIFLLLSGLGKFTAKAGTEIVLPELDDNAIQCGSEYVNITLSDEYLNNEIGLNDIEKLVLVTDKDDLNNYTEECTAERTSTGFTFFLGDSYGQCSLETKVVDDCAFVYYQLWVVRIAPLGADIVRVTQYRFSLHCKYNIKLTGNVGPFLPWAKRKNLIVNEKKQDFQAEIDLFTDIFFNETIENEEESVKVRVPHTIFVGIWLIAKEDSRLILQARQCWVTPTDNPEDERRFYIISNDGCLVNDATTNGNNGVEENFASIHVYFFFNAFYWALEGIPSSRLYVHCGLTVCDPEVEDCAKPRCTRQARSLTMDKTEGGTTVTYGPIELENNPKDFDSNDQPIGQVKNYIQMEDTEPDRENPRGSIDDEALNKDSTSDQMTADSCISRIDRICDKENLGCSYDCAVGNFGEELCICPLGFGVKEDGKFCFQHKTVIQEAEHSYKTEYVFPTVAMLAMMIICITILIKKVSDESYH